jgi:hypothetical protein
MSDQPAASSTLPPPSPDEGGPVGLKRRVGVNKFLFLVALALALHVALVFIFGTKKAIVPRPVDNAPHLQLADSASQFIALGDPTLFARPNARDLVTAFWRRTPPITQRNFNWTEAPRFLPPAPEDFGATFREFMQASRRGEFPLNFKPAPQAAPPALAFDEAPTQRTTMQITGELARRRLLTAATNLPSLPLNDVIAPSRVQALVDAAGNVASAVLLPSDNDLEADGRSVMGDSNALAIARSLRFAPAPALTFGQIIFNWHTVPVTTTNALP